MSAQSGRAIPATQSVASRRSHHTAACASTDTAVLTAKLTTTNVRHRPVNTTQRAQNLSTRTIAPAPPGGTVRTASSMLTNVSRLHVHMEALAFNHHRMLQSRSTLSCAFVRMVGKVLFAPLMWTSATVVHACTTELAANLAAAARQSTRMCVFVPLGLPAQDAKWISTNATVRLARIEPTAPIHPTVLLPLQNTSARVQKAGTEATA